LSQMLGPDTEENQEEDFLSTHVHDFSAGPI